MSISCPNFARYKFSNDNLSSAGKVGAVLQPQMQFQPPNTGAKAAVPGLCTCTCQGNRELAVRMRIREASACGGIWRSRGIRSATGSNAEFTPRDQDQGRGFYQDLAQPSQAVRGGAAVLDATKGLPQQGPAATARPVQPGAKFYQQGANQSWQHWEKSTQFGFVSEMQPGNFVAEKIIEALRTENSLEQGCLNVDDRYRSPPPGRTTPGHKMPC